MSAITTAPGSGAVSISCLRHGNHRLSSLDRAAAPPRQLQATLQVRERTVRARAKQKPAPYGMGGCAVPGLEQASRIRQGQRVLCMPSCRVELTPQQMNGRQDAESEHCRWMLGAGPSPIRGCLDVGDALVVLLEPVRRGAEKQERDRVRAAAPLERLRCGRA
jgi:hypothetical protein